MEALTPWHLLLILIAFVLLAGYKKLPDAARSVGRSLRIFRGEMRALDGEQPSAASPAGTSDQALATAAFVAPQQPALSAAELEREAAAADETAAQLRARAAVTSEGQPGVA